MKNPVPKIQIHAASDPYNHTPYGNPRPTIFKTIDPAKLRVNQEENACVDMQEEIEIAIDAGEADTIEGDDEAGEDRTEDDGEILDEALPMLAIAPKN